MENLLLSFNVVAPLLVYMIVGALLKRTGVVDDRILRGANNLIFYVTLPLMCYRAIAASNLDAMFDTPFLLYMALAILALYALAALLVPLFSSENKRRGVLIMGVFRSNDAIFGLAVAAALLGENNLGMMSIGISMCVPLYSLLSVISMERYRGERIRVSKVLLRVATNPIILGCAAGFLVNLLQIQLPIVLQKPVDGLASVTTPLAFVLLGGTISFSAVRKNRAAATAVSILRLLVIPIIVVSIFLLLGFRGEFIVVTLIIFGAPVAMVTYTMSLAMDADSELAATLVAVTSVLSIFTMFLFIFLLKEFAWI
ncbi:MAG: AEC family transporter [Eubacteriales bacterium]